ncbi:hypothetical protein ARAM_000151 [Aspergillus rambellii]|uniref:Uncharacterized protein n=1 Tax=Aspergillus rambellii TaxID=308745 RepID=A0A0F8VC32_9EURO|nr:hypothetical protein ARAM_000151 [Aspergillus rambellii]
MGDSDICCRTNAICTSDDANHIACCPVGASCTGTLTDPSTGTGSFQFPQSTSATTTTSGGSEATITGSTLSGAYPFVYVPTTFSNADVCSSYYTQCQSEYTACITSLGGGYGVTVSGGGAELTRSGGAAGAVETCSSLSLAACHGLNLGYCGNYAGGSSSDGVSRRASNLQDLLFGVVIGITAPT